MSPDHVTGVILAGGEGRRMQGADKGLIEWQGRPLVGHVIERIAPQVDQLVISANRHLDRYAALGYEVITDQLHEADGGHAGPLAGLQAAIAHARHDWILCVPCDAPCLPHDLLAVLRAGIGTQSLARAATDVRTHPTVCLLHRRLAAALDAYLARGERRFSHWQEAAGAVDVLFPAEAAFANLNTPDELAAASGSP